MTTNNNLKDKILLLQRELCLSACLSINDNATVEELNELMEDPCRDTFEADAYSFADCEIDTDPSDDLDEFIYQFLTFQVNNIKDNGIGFIDPCLLNVGGVWWFSHLL